MTDLDRYFLNNINKMWALTQVSETILLTIYGEDGIIKKIFDNKGMEVTL